MIKDKFKLLSLDEKRRFLSRVRDKLESKGQERGAGDDLYTPFPLLDIQDAYLMSRLPSAGSDYTGCHIYFEIEEHKVNTDRLTTAWNKLVEYHPMLRAKILSRGKQQILQKVPDYKIAIFDFRQRSDHDFTAHLESVRKRLSHKVYPLDQWPFFEVCVSKRDGAPDIIHLSIDDLIVDAYSVKMLLGQWRELYQNPSSYLPNLPYSFRDYVLAAKEFEKSKQFKRDLDYWTDTLATIPQGPCLNKYEVAEAAGFSGETGRSGEKQLSRRRYQNTLDETAWSLLKNKAQNLGVSPTVILLFLFSKFLLHWNKYKDFSLVLTLFGRQPFNDSVDRLVGTCTSTNVFVVNDDSELSSNDELKHYQQILWQQLNHPNVSSIRAFRELKRQRKLNEPINLPVVFTSLLDIKNETHNAAWFDQVNYAITQTPGVALDHHVQEVQGRLKYNWDVVDALFEQGLLAHMFSEYQAFLKAMAHTPELWEQNFTQANHHNNLIVDFASQSVDEVSALILKEDVSAKHQSFGLCELQKAYLVGKATNVIDNKLCVYQEFDVESFDPTRLDRALSKLLETHAMLRAVIQADGTQIVLPEVQKYQIAELDFAGIDSSAQKNELAKRRQALLATDFKQGSWPSFSLSVSHLGESKARVHLLVDLLIADGYSIHLLMDQLQYLYSADVSHRLKTPKASYRDYIQALERHKKTSAYAASQQYWNKKFSGISCGPDFIFSSKSANHAGVNAQARRLAAVIENGVALRDMAVDRGLSLTAVLLTAYNLVLKTFSKSDEFTTVVVSWDRPDIHADINTTVGEFTRLSWVATDGKATPFIKLVEQTAEVLRRDLQQAPDSALSSLSKYAQLKFPVVFTDLITQKFLPRSSTDLNRGYGVTQTPGVMLDASAQLVGNDLHLHWDALLNFLPEDRLQIMLQAYQALLQDLLHQADAWQKTDFTDVLSKFSIGESSDDAHWRYWQQRLPSLLEPPALPVASAFDGDKVSGVGRKEVVLAAEQWQQFKINAGVYNLEPWLALYTAFAEVVAAWSNQRHFCLRHVSVQPASNTQAMLYPLEIELKKGHSFIQHAASIGAQVERDATHFLSCANKLYEALTAQQTELNGSENSIAIVNNFSLSGSRPATLCQQGIRGTALDHQFNELTDGRLWLAFDELEAHFPCDLIDDMWLAYQGLIAELTAHPEAWVNVAFDLIPDKQRLTRQTVASKSVVIPNTRLESLLSEQAFQPTVLRMSNASLTYAELVHDSDRLAASLKLYGVQAGDHIAIVSDRGAELLKFVYATLKVGAAYIPIDPSLPEQRRNYFLDNSCAKLVLTQRGYVDQLVWPKDITLLTLDNMGRDALVTQENGAATDMAYMIYTSGSTGQPKAVMIDHCGALNTVLDINSRFAVSATDRIFGVSAFSFDLSVYDIFGAVAAGATLIYPDADKLLNAGHWLDLMLNQQVTVWNSAPPLAVLMIEAAERRGISLPDLRLLMLSGDWIPVSLPDRIRRIAPQAKVVSLGGATEASIWSVLYEVDQVDPKWPSIPYGYPMTNQSWHILDDWGRPAPDWVAGDLYIGGIGLAMGYWNDSTKTQASFIKHPQTGERIYRTGDLGRYIPGGAIEFLGRSDFQVKVSGHRIELGEIETLLEKQACISQAVVTVVEANTPSAKLVAYLVPSAANIPNSDSPNANSLNYSAIKAMLSAALPSYMVPNHFASLSAMPVTPNGKLDRKALPWPLSDETLSDQALDERATQTATSPVAIENAKLTTLDVAKQLSALLTDYLEVDDISASDDLFDLGLTSFMSLQLCQQIEERYALPMTANDLLQNPTIESISATILAHASSADSYPSQAPIEPEPAYENKQSTLSSLEQFSAGSILASDFAAEQSAKPEQTAGSGLDAKLKDLAIVGIHCRLPGAENAEEFWRNIESSTISVTQVSERRLKLWPADSSEPGQHKYHGRWGGFLEDMDCFDHQLFDVSAVEARSMDPQERLCLESVWACLEDANYTADSLNRSASRVGVFVAAMWNDYQNLGARSRQASNAILTSWHSAIANRISFAFDFQGPSVAIDTSCSSSLTAIHYACESLRRNECDVAIVSGVNVISDPYHHKILSSMGLLSDQENCFSFGAQGSGWIVSEGVGSILIRSEKEAVRHKDHIYGLIKGSAIGHSGATARFGMPNSKAQATCINKAIADSGIELDDISYVECAAPGANLADAEEVSALLEVFEARSTDSQACLLGSVKPNVGHLESASAMSQLIKLLMQFKYGKIAPSLNCETFNPLMRLRDSALKINRELIDWPGRKLAMINAIGGSGSSAHVVLQAYENHSAAHHQRPSPVGPNLIPFAAKTDAQLATCVARLDAYIEHQLATGTALRIDDIAYSLQIGRVPLPHRILLVSHDLNQLRLQLSNYQAGAHDSQALSGQGIFTADIHASLASELKEPNMFNAAVTWLKGRAVDWQALSKLLPQDENFPRKLPLPTYPFARESHWAYANDEDGHSESSSTVIPVAVNGNGAGDKQDQGKRFSDRIVEQISGYLRSKSIEPCMHKSLMEMGVDSISMTWLKFDLEQKLACDIPISLLCKEVKLSELVASLENEVRINASSEFNSKHTRQDKEPHQKRPKLEVIQGNDQLKPFPLMDIQSAYLSGRLSNSGLGQVGCHIYVEVEEVAVDIQRLRLAWKQLLDYHPMLRTRILLNGTQCVFENPPPYDIEVYDFSDASPESLETHIQSVRHRLSHKVYQADQWPFFEICVTRCPTKTDIIHLSIDELIVDALSFMTLLKQWYQLYQNPDFVLPGLSYSFRDYVLQLKAQESTPGFKASLDYWLQKMATMPDGPQLPRRSVSQIPANQERRRYEQTLDESLWRSLKDKAEALNVYPTTLLLLLFSELLSSRSDRADFSLLLTVFNRTPFNPQVNQVLGPFISTNVFVVESTHDLSLNDKLKRFQTTLWQDMDHSNVSSIRALRELKRRDVSKANLVLPVVITSMVSFDMNDLKANQKSWLDQIGYSVTQTPDVMFDHQVYEHKGALKITWDIALGVFPDGVIDEMFLAYETLLKSAATDSALWQTAPADLNSVLGAAKKNSRDLPVKPSPLSIQTDLSSRHQKFALSDQQQAYVFGKMVESANNKLLVYQEFDCDSYNSKTLNEVLQVLINTHEMLRAVINSDGSQIILQTRPDYAIKEYDLCACDAATQQSKLSQRRAACLETTFELDQWPFFSLIVSKLSSRKARIHLVIDMLIADGDSILLIMQQLRKLYDAAPNIKLAVPSLSFRDYMQAAIEHKSSTAYQTAIKHWQQRFEAISDGPKFPGARYDLLQEKIQRESFKAVLRNWPVIKQKAKEYGLTPSVILLSAYNLCIQASSQSGAFTTVVVNWQRLPLHPDIHKVVGDFTALSWVETKADGANFVELARHYQQTIDADLAQRPVSGLSVLRKLPELSFPIVFTSLAQVEHPKNGQHTLKMGYGISQTPQVLLDNISEEIGEELHLHWDAATNILPRTMVQVMFRAYQTMLKKLTDDSQAWEQMDFSEILYEPNSSSAQQLA